MTKEGAEFSPRVMRVKITGAVDIDPKVELSDEEAARFELCEAFQAASSKLSASLEMIRRFPRDYTFLQPTPEIVTLSEPMVEELAKIIKEKSGLNIYEYSVPLRYRGETYLLSIEYPCG